MSWQYVRAAVEGGFWGRLRALVRGEVVPYQWKALNDEIPGAPPSWSIANFRVAAGMATGERRGLVFQDSDLYKWLEAAGHLLADRSPADAGIQERVEETVGLIARAQQPDGYVNTWFTVKEPARQWTNLREAHELYCAGHLIEAGVAVHRGTGNAGILDVVRRLADHIDSRFGVGAGKLRGYPGHEEVELALVKLYRLTGEKRYLALAKYFIDERGRPPSWFEEEARRPGYAPIWPSADWDLAYYQAHRPVREQTEATGHAVRAMYLGCGMADVAKETGDEPLARACDRLWESATSRRMYVTGGVGSAEHGEAFTFDYDLPNDTAYAETCAAIGLFLFSHRMAHLRHHGRYGDVMELALYNGALAGLALDGRSYFYVNPLEVVPEACDRNPTLRHVKYRRQSWYGCACCPPNIARLIASLGEYAYRVEGNVLYADLFHDGTISCTVGVSPVSFSQRTQYPWSDLVTFEYGGEAPAELDLAIRVPAWCREPSIALGGKPVDLPAALRDGYAHLRRTWKRGDRVELSLPMAAERVRANPRVRADWGKVAVRRGPVIYCLEEEDNGPRLHTAMLPAASELRSDWREDLFGGVEIVTARGRTWSGRPPEGPLYQSVRWPDQGSVRQPGAPPMGEKDLVFIPYYAWANRGPGEMTVWVREQP